MIVVVCILFGPQKYIQHVSQMYKLMFKKMDIVLILFYFNINIE